MIKVKVIKCNVSTPGVERDGLSDYQVSALINKFCEKHDVVDIKVSTVVQKRHNNGGFDGVELWYTILYQKGTESDDHDEEQSD